MDAGLQLDFFCFYCIKDEGDAHMINTCDVLYSYNHVGRKLFTSLLNCVEDFGKSTGCPPLPLIS